tara:strand:+ start:555 stop:1232 length:678 start_codon:yes stop_codon:yes gene_type:complete
MTQGPETPYSNTKRRPKLSDLVAAANRSAELDLRVCFPATVTEVQDNGARVKVTPDIKNVLATGDGEQIVEQIELSEIPVWTYGQGAVGGGFLQFSVRVGDKGWVIVNDRSLDGWYENGLPDQPAGYHTHDSSDGIFMPGARDSTRALAQDPSGAAVFEDAAIKIGAGASLGAARTKDAVDATAEMITWMNLVAAAAITGQPGPPIPFPAGFGLITGGSTKTKIE